MLLYLFEPRRVCFYRRDVRECRPLEMPPRGYESEEEGEEESEEEGEEESEGESETREESSGEGVLKTTPRPENPLAGGGRP